MSINRTLNIVPSQHSGFPKGLIHTTITTPSQSVFNFGSTSIIDLKTKGVKIHELVLAFNTSACTGVTANGSTLPVLNPAFYWFSRLEILINNVVMDTIYPDSNFIFNQLYYADEDRLLNSYAAGHYSNVSNRYALTNTNNSNWYINLKCLFNQNHMSILSNNHEIQLRVTMAPLANIINQGALVGTPSVTINSCSLISRVTQLDNATNNKLLLEMVKIPRHNLFLATRYMPINIQSGVSSSTIVLTGIVGSVHSIYFVVRASNALTGANQYSYNTIKDFQILDAFGSNIVGGVPIPSTYNLLMQGKYWSQSTFQGEGFTGVNNSNVYMYSFSVDPSSAMKNSAHYSTKTFTGNEQLIINYNSALASATQVDIYGLVESAVEQTATGCKLINL